MSGSNVGRRSLGRFVTRSARRALVAVIALIALGVTVPAVASATPSFQWKGKNYMPLAAPEGAEWSGTVKMTALETKFGNRLVECTVKLIGTIGLGNRGTVTEVASSSCVHGGICGGTGGATIKGADLPWATELVEVGGFELKDLFFSDGKGTPGLIIECLVGGLATSNTCTGSMHIRLSKIEPATGSFVSEEPLTCTGAGENVTGVVEGTESIVGQANIEEETPVWLKSGWQVTTNETMSWSKGKLTLTDKVVGVNKGDWSVACEDAGEEVVGTEGTGSITKLTFSNCKNNAGSECNGTDSVLSSNLPWKTQLFMGKEEAISNLLENGGTGKPSFWINCEISGIKDGESCEAGSRTGGNLATFLTDLEGQSSALASFYTKEFVTLKCTRDGAEEAGEITEGSYTIGRGVEL